MYSYLTHTCVLAGQYCDRAEKLLLPSNLCCSRVLYFSVCVAAIVNKSCVLPVTQKNSSMVMESAWHSMMISDLEICVFALIHLFSLSCTVLLLVKEQVSCEVKSCGVPARGSMHFVFIKPRDCIMRWCEVIVLCHSNLCKWCDIVKVYIHSD